MTDLIGLLLPFALSFALVSPFYLVLRANRLAFVAGATLVAVGAYALESLSQTVVGALDGPLLVLLLLAPVIEELLKLAVSLITGGNYETAAGAGIGFAASENALYFLAAWGSPMLTLVALIGVRAFTDPLLHATTCTLTTSSWRGQPWALPGGILLHIGWNVVALVVVSLSVGWGLVLLLAASLIVLGILATARQSPSFRDALAGAPTPYPWTGTRA